MSLTATALVLSTLGGLNGFEVQGIDALFDIIPEDVLISSRRHKSSEAVSITGLIA